MKIFTEKEKISREELAKMSEKVFEGFVKGVVDVEKKIVAVDAEMHSDLEGFLLEKGSKQNMLWGINIYPEGSGNDLVEFDSMINIRPRQGNRSRGVEDVDIQRKIVKIIKSVVL